ncbi:MULTISPECIES: hypothetical protein [Brevibacillus]|uniref:Uncharacterized protein n=1 Tax=Brevibacillus laterosporus LMG 15441 TaxID=1042163 RepID=A0A075R771_BRELA|nr:MULTISPECIES: hypothetical protein [Brevibacillus]AIG27053.1 hypothetical protein BRLA_c027340 [Brevibacillus laterosporus LMG 15441]AUM65466.1 hypothetical protein C0R09_13525 [Brevibacillus laterosporus]AYK08472.1 hypothetical protein D8Z77_20050 [Brevibacillus laterosporus]ERM15910.1 hypothetical protein P615_06380 [Brevibacillus laterosporus PE36]MBA4532025.1 hypothetical protein [Brevibacillus halotolerans]
MFRKELEEYIGFEVQIHVLQRIIYGILREVTNATVTVRILNGPDYSEYVDVEVPMLNISYVTIP